MNLSRGLEKIHWQTTAKKGLPKDWLKQTKKDAARKNQKFFI